MRFNPSSAKTSLGADKREKPITRSQVRILAQVLDKRSVVTDQHAPSKNGQRQMDFGSAGKRLTGR